MLKKNKRKISVLIIILFILGLTWWAGLFGQKLLANTLSAQVGNTNDDADENCSQVNGSVFCAQPESCTIDTSKVILGQLSYTLGGCINYVWHNDCMAFGNITLSSSDTVDSSYLTIRASNDPLDVTDMIKNKIYLHDADNVNTGSSHCYGAPVYTTNNSNWNISDWDTDVDYTSADFASAVQEVIDRSGWSSGNNIRVYIRNQKDFTTSVQADAYDYTNSASHATKLTITYTPGGIPEFNTWTLALTVLAAFLAIMVMRRYVFAPSRTRTQ